MIRSICRVFFREVNFVLGSREGLVMLFVAPVLFIGSVCGVYWNKKIVEIPISIVDQDNSSLTREMICALDATESFHVVNQGQNITDFEYQVKNGDSRACFVFPRYFARDIKRGNPVKLLVLMDASNIIIANVISSNASTVLGAYSAGIDIRKTLAKGRINRQSVMKVAVPIKDEYRTWYNPSLNSNYANFMLAGMSMVVVQLITLLIVAGSCSKEFEGLAEVKFGVFTLIIGKCLAYSVLTAIPGMLVVLLPIMFAGLPIVGSLGLLMVVTCWFVCILCVFGIGVSALVGDTLQTTEYFAIIAMPAFLLSGYTWPDIAMPRFIVPIAHSLPLTAPAILARKICLMGAGADMLRAEIRTMVIWSVFAIVVALLGGFKLKGKLKTVAEASH